MVGLLGAFALLLGAAGLSKLIRPASAVQALRGALPEPIRRVAGAGPVRVLSSIEIAVAFAVLLGGGGGAAALTAAAYLVLTAVAARMLRVAPGADCGCIGSSSQPVSRWHLAVTAAGATVGVAGVVWPQPAVLSAVVGNGGEGLALAADVLVLAWLLSLAMTALPELENRRAEVAGR